MSKKDAIKTRNVVFLGIIYSVKKIENLIKAISISECFKRSDSLLLIAGKPLVGRDYDYMAMLFELVKFYNLESKIKFVGEVFGNEKDRFLNDAYVLVLPSEVENFGNVITEALSQSTPVITTKGTPWKILKDKNIGWWIDNDPNSLKAAIDEALSLAKEEYMIKSRESLNLVKEKFNINSSIDNKWIEIYSTK
jgi:glycosyltransferase involved in cell wall biosynthesis